MFKRFQALKKGVETIKKVAPKLGTRKSDQIKKSNRMIKDLDKTLKKELGPKLRSEGEKLKKEVEKTRKQIYKSKMADGGSISPKDIEKMKEKAEPAAKRAFDILRKFGDKKKKKNLPVIPPKKKDKPKSIKEKIAPKKKMDRLKELKKELG
tara:strand:+ start:23 stop:478 length:456 start_codon:yes stop_codon:yes gene_type:complete